MVGARHVWLEGDAKVIVDVIKKRKQMKKIKCEEVQKHVSHINSIIRKLNDCIVSHIYWEGNRAADKFAQMGHWYQKPQIWEHIPPHQVLSIMDEDAEGKVLFRKIRWDLRELNEATMMP